MRKLGAIFIWIQFAGEKKKKPDLIDSTVVYNHGYTYLPVISSDAVYLYQISVDCTQFLGFFNSEVSGRNSFWRFIAGIVGE